MTNIYNLYQFVKSSHVDSVNLPVFRHLDELSATLVDLAEVNEGDLANIRDGEIQLQDDYVFDIISDNI